MKDNTPDPFGDKNFYYELHERPSQYPQPAYGVAAWWDYGYWITRIGHRVPWSNPGQVGAKIIGQLFLAQDEMAINLRAKYVVIDNDTTTGKFYALPAGAESKAEDFMDYYHPPGENYLLIHYYPRYYRSLAVRLYNFNGGQVIPESTTVLSYEERIAPEGQHYKEILDTKSFSNYTEAEAYIAGQDSGNYQIASPNPFVSPVPLEKLNYFRYVHSSDSSILQPGAGSVPEVKIFEFAADSFDDTPIAGDWNGDSADTIGFYRPSNSTFHLDYDNDGTTDIEVAFADSGDKPTAGDRPITGDWNGDGTDTIGFYRPGNATFYLDYDNDGIVDTSQEWGVPNEGEIPLIGDWNNDDTDTTGVYRSFNSSFHPDELVTQAVKPLQICEKDGIPVTGDWNGDGTVNAGIYCPGNSTFYLDYDNDGKVDQELSFGRDGDRPIIGDWNGNDIDTIGVYSPGTRTFRLDYDNDGKADFSVQQLQYIWQ
jgi:hypothetical protein